MPASFQSEIFADEDERRDFDTRMLGMLCAGEADQAVHEVLARFDELAGGQHPIAALCRESVDAAAMTGWHHLAELGADTAAIQFNLSWPGHFERGPAPDEGRAPVIETTFYPDGAGNVQFSTWDRENLAAACWGYATPWQGKFRGGTHRVQLSGLDRLNGAVWNLERPGVEKDHALSPSDHDAHFLGAIFLALALSRAIEDAIKSQGLPRPVAVLIGSNEASPGYAAPVMSTAESAPFAGQGAFSAVGRD